MKLKSVYEKVTNSKITLIVNAVMGLLAVLFYLSAHTMLGFIGYFTFAAFPYILGAMIIASAVVALVLLLYKNNRIALTVTLIFNGIALLFSLGYFFAFISHYKTFLLETAKILCVYALIAVIVYLCFFHGKKEYRGRKTVAIVLCCVLTVGSILCFTDFSSLKINFIDDEPVVYAVGNDYQIVWTTAAEGTGEVKIGEYTYYDIYAGQKRSSQKVHKVTVPQEVLDENKEYTVSSRAMLSEQGFSGLLGYTVKKTYSFRPVDVSDGIQTYVLSDTHEFNGAAAKAASYYGDSLDFLVLAGDHVNYLYNDDQLSRILNLGHKVTGGSRPVVFARGNHELKCENSESLDRYVGSLNERFYYTFRLKNVWGVVLDMGEDHDDDWKEFYGTALYKDYRKEQRAFLDGIIADKENEYEADGVEYRIGISHISTSITDYDRPFMYDDLLEINDRLNVMNLDVMLSGHQHLVFKVNEGYEAGRPLFFRKEYTGKEVSVTPDYIAAGANYPTLMAGRRSDGKLPVDKTSFYKFTGIAVEFLSDGNYARFTNHKKEVVYSINPFENEEYGKIMVL